MISLSPRVDLTWPLADRQAVERGTVIAGMSREMVAAAIGYPPIYGDAQTFNGLDTWTYDEPAPFRHEVFFKDDRVVRYDPPGELP